MSAGGTRQGRSVWVRNVWLSCAAVLVLAVSATFVRFHVPGHGFTFVLDYGGSIGLPRLPEVEQLPVFIHRDVTGYDAQFYSQLAIHPAATDEDLPRVIDSLPYRARRVLMGAVAWCIGLGDPWRVLNVFACLNFVAWLALAGILLRWFPPVGVHEMVRWAGVLFSAGLLGSVRHALTDGPALLILVLVMYLVETRRPWAAALCGALGALTRETCVLNTALFAPAKWSDWRSWPPALLRGVIVVAPLALWLAYLNHEIGGRFSDGTGYRNFSFPFQAYAARWAEVCEPLLSGSFPKYVFYSFLGHVAVTVQAFYIVLRPRWSSAWWRVAAVHVALMAVLGEAVWEGFPGAALRVLLPLTLCFNILVPRTRRGMILLLAGNLSIFAGVSELRPPPPAPIWTVSAEAPLRNASGSRDAVSVDFAEGFYGQEAGSGNRWRWAEGTAVLAITNHASVPARIEMSFEASVFSARTVTLTAAGVRIWSGELGDVAVTVECEAFVAPPGVTRIEIQAGIGGHVRGDERSLALRVFALTLKAAPAGE